jgi:hypothetical protein
MKHSGIPLKNVRLSKDGKLVKFSKPRDASHKIQQRKSKRVRVAKKGATR